MFCFSLLWCVISIVVSAELQRGKKNVNYYLSIVRWHFCLFVTLNQYTFGTGREREGTILSVYLSFIVVKRKTTKERGTTFSQAPISIEQWFHPKSQKQTARWRKKICYGNPHTAPFSVINCILFVLFEKKICFSCFLDYFLNSSTLALLYFFPLKTTFRKETSIPMDFRFSI